jgi:hypothetical protein
MTITKYEHLKHRGNLGDAEHQMERIAIGNTTADCLSNGVHNN